MEMKQKSCHGIYSNLLSYLLDKKILNIFLSFVIRVNRTNGNKTKSGIFDWGIFKSYIIYHWLQKTKIFQ